MFKQTEEQPAKVSEVTKQAGEIRERWNWVEPSVWTDRMLAALENGVKGGVWYSLIDKVYRLDNLKSSFKEVKKNDGSSGVDHQTIEMYENQLEENLAKLSVKLKEGSYEVEGNRRSWITKLGSKEKRPLGIPTVQDRVVQGALRHVLEPIFERGFVEQSYGFRPGRGCKDALRRVDELLKEGYGYVVDADWQSYFETIPHELLMKKLEKKVADSEVLKLVKAYLGQKIIEGIKEWTPTGGTPQGAIISPLLSNIYLDDLDQRLLATRKEAIRYADDLVIMCKTKEEAESALEEVREWTEAMGLKLHPEKTKIVETSQEGFDFLGYRFEGGRKWPRQKSEKKLRDAIRGKTGRCNGKSLNAIIAEVNRTTQGWFEYFKHSNRRTFPKQDGWIRRRLRSLLQKRQGRPGHGNGRAHQKWPNAYFVKQGLFTMTIAHARLCQSA